MQPTVLTLKCIYCHQLPKNTQELMEINYFGFHLKCDHVLADTNPGKVSNDN
jgi:hypothetical protein